MGMIIHDDYYEAMMQLPPKQRGSFLEAVVVFGFTGDEPDGNPPWLPVFTVIKKRISLSVERAKAGSKGGAKRKQTLSKAEAKLELASDLPTRVEDEDELQDELEPYSPFDFALRCIDALNRELGTTYSEIPGECLRTLERHEAEYSVEDVGSMIAAKREEWSGDAKTRRWLTPHTLFAPDKFEKYMIQSQQDRKEDESYAYGSDDIQDL